MIKIFSHRGLVTASALENSLASLHAAYAAGFRAIEFDIWFLEGQLVLSHNKPRNISNLPKFSEYFFYGNEMEYWLDFKNLDATNVEEALAMVKKEISVAANVAGNQNISRNQNDLSKQISFAKIDEKKLFFAPFITNLDEAAPVYTAIRHNFSNAQIVAVCEKISASELVFYQQNLRRNGVKFLSIYHGNIDANFVKIFKDISLFAWTVNDLARLRELAQLGVENFASDKILPEMLVTF